MKKHIRSALELGGIVETARKQQNLRQFDTAGLIGVGARFLSNLSASTPAIFKLHNFLNWLVVKADRCDPSECEVSSPILLPPAARYTALELRVGHLPPTIGSKFDSKKLVSNKTLRRELKTLFE